MKPVQNLTPLRLGKVPPKLGTDAGRWAPTPTPLLSFVLESLNQNSLALQPLIRTLAGAGYH